MGYVQVNIDYKHIEFLAYRATRGQGFLTLESNMQPRTLGKYTGDYETARP
jgi:hypothetical protein